MASFNKQGLATLKLSKIMKTPTVRIILFLYEKGEARHAELSKLIKSRGTLSNSLKDLETEQIIQRKIKPTKPIQSLYSLTEKGKTTAKQLKEIQNQTK